MTASTTTAPSIAAVAHELVTLVRGGKAKEAISRLYGPDIVSVEPRDFEQLPAEIKGIDAVKGKNEWWFANNEVHKVEVNGPFLGEGQFAVQYKWDSTSKPTGQRQLMTEMALYTVKDGKIVREEFYYNAPKE